MMNEWVKALLIALGVILFIAVGVAIIG